MLTLTSGKASTPIRRPAGSKWRFAKMANWRHSSLIRRSAFVAVIAAVVVGGVWGINRWRVRAPERPVTHRVVGKIYVNGVPAGNASIAFHPIGDHAAESYRPVGVSKPDGSFT